MKECAKNVLNFNWLLATKKKNVWLAKLQVQHYAYAHPTMCITASKCFSNMKIKMYTCLKKILLQNKAKSSNYGEIDQVHRVNAITNSSNNSTD